MPCHRREIDDVADMLFAHGRQNRGNAVKHALDVDVDHLIPLVDLEFIERRRQRHQAGVVDQHIDAAIGLLRRLGQRIELSTVSDVGNPVDGITALLHDRVAQRRKRSSSRRAPSTNLAPLLAKRWAVALPRPLLAPVMITTFPLISDMVSPPVDMNCWVP